MTGGALPRPTCEPSSYGHPGSAQMCSVRMSTGVLSGTLIPVGSRVRAHVRPLADPPAPRDHGLCSPRPWRARLVVRETSAGMNLPGSLRRSPARSSDRHQMRGECHDMTDSAGSGPSDRSESRVIPTVPEAFARLDMSLLEAMMTQRAVRRVLPDPVDDAIVLKCIELGLRAPTGSNSQNWEFVVVKDQKVKEQLAARYRESWSVYGSLGGRAAGGDESMLKILRAVQWQVDHFAEIPVLVVPCLRAGVRAGKARPTRGSRRSGRPAIAPRAGSSTSTRRRPPPAPRGCRTPTKTRDS